MIGQNRSPLSNQKVTMLSRKAQETKAWAGLVKLWSMLTGRSRYLLDLATVQATEALTNYHYTGGQTVALRQICGSASGGRSRDFDANFRPLKAHNEARWQSVYAARQRGLNLPPVILIQVGEMYFVEDGHHRISVAKTRGEQTIEAEVTVWKVAGRLPWEQSMVVSA